MLPIILKMVAGLHVVALAAIVYMIQQDRFEAIKKGLAVSALTLFVTGAGLIYYLEEIQPFIWDNTNPYAKQQGGGGGDQASGKKSGGKKKKGGPGAGEEDDDDDDSSSDGGGGAGSFGGAGSSAGRGKAGLQDCDECPEMIVITRGTFIMGAPADEADAKTHEQPQVPDVKINSFAIGRFEVTRDQYRAFVKATGYQGAASCSPGMVPGLADSKSLATKVGLNSNGWHPVSCVTWDDAQAYAAWLGKHTGRTYRLPSAAEWEFAARADEPAPFQTGGLIGPKQAHFGQSAKAGSLPVGTFPGNRHGLFDMHGNVAEWVEDCWTGTLKHLPPTGRPFVQTIGCKRVVKGGSWQDEASGIRFAVRVAMPPSQAANTVGFRVARDLD